MTITIVLVHARLCGLVQSSAGDRKKMLLTSHEQVSVISSMLCGTGHGKVAWSISCQSRMRHSELMTADTGDHQPDAVEC